MRKLIAFLGLTDYRRVTYRYRGNDCVSPYVQAALAGFLTPDRVIVLVTEEAKAKHGNALTEELERQGLAPDCLDLTPIPVGKSEADLWGIFEIISSSLDDGDQVYFDITHSFRSQPLLVLLAATYLRVAKRVQIEGIFYGALEAKQPPGDPRIAAPTDVAPVFDLTPFVELLDWTTATDKYLDTGDARGLGRLLKDVHARNRTNRAPSAPNLPQHLQNLGETLRRVSQAQELIQPLVALPCGHKLQNLIVSSDAEAEISVFARPFQVLLERVRRDVEPFALAKGSPLLENLAAQYKLILWYLDRDRIVQAVTLAREWTLSIVCFKLDADSWLSKDTREAFARALNQTCRRRRGDPLDALPECGAIAALAEIDAVVRLWDAIPEIRNGIDHAGMSEQGPKVSTDSLYKRALNLRKPIEELAVASGIVEGQPSDDPA